MLILPLALVGCKYDAPVAGNPVLNVIAGSVVWGEGTPPYTTIVSAFSVENPPPPNGFGKPVVADAIGAEQFSQAAGIESGAFWLTHLPDDEYLVTALMDVDGNFNPFVGTLAGATCGDWVGLHTTDLTSGIPSVVAVSGGQIVQDVPVVIGSRSRSSARSSRSKGNPI